MQREYPYAKSDGALNREASHGKLRAFSPRGRIGRLRYLAWVGAAQLLMLATLVPVFWFVVPRLNTADPGSALSVSYAVFLTAGTLLWIGVNVLCYCWTVQRSHDFNASGYWALLLLVPLAPLFFMFIPGTDRPNRYGNPAPPNSTGVRILAVSGLLGVVWWVYYWLFLFLKAVAVAVNAVAGAPVQTLPGT